MEQIYKSHLDNDLYKFHMGSFFWDQHRGIDAEYAYRCRDNSIDLTCIEYELKEQIIAMRDITLTPDEKRWLFENTMVTGDYLNNFLNHF